MFFPNFSKFYSLNSKITSLQLASPKCPAQKNVKIVKVMCLGGGDVGDRGAVVMLAKTV